MIPISAISTLTGGAVRTCVCLQRLSDALQNYKQLISSAVTEALLYVTPSALVVLCPALLFLNVTFV